MFKYNRPFTVAMQRAFHDFDKRMYFASAYGSYKAALIYGDFKSMYQMGGEL